jgi:hypothetical protein
MGLTIPNIGTIPKLGFGGSSSPHWNPLNFLTANSATDNVTALQDAVDNHRKIYINKPGVYQVNGTVWIPSNTEIKFCAGCTIKKIANGGSPYVHVFANKGIQTYSRNTDIKIIGNGLIFDQNGQDDTASTAIRRMRGIVNFFGVDNLVLDGFNHSNGQSNEFFGHLGDISNFVIRNMNIETLKACFQFQGKCFDGLLEDITTDSLDDSLALNATDWPIVSASIGDIKRITIRRWTDNQIVHAQFANGCRMQPGSWSNWVTGTTYNKSDFVVNAGNVYSKSSATAQVSSVAPTHTSGKHTGADGIEWWWLQAGTETSASITDINYDDIDVNASGAHIGVQSSNDDNYRAIFPGTEGNGYIDNIVFDNIHYNPPAGANSYLFGGGGYMKKVTLQNSTIAPSNTCDLFYLYAALAGASNGTMDDFNINNCIITMPASSYVYKKFNTCTGKKVTIQNSTINLTGNELLYHNEANGEVHADVSLTNTTVNGMLQLLEYGHCYDISIIANNCVFSNVSRLLYRGGTSGNGVSFTGVGCTYSNPSLDYLFKSADNKLTINTSGSSGSITQTKVADTNVVVTACDLFTAPAIPSGLTLSLISGGVKIDWTDNSSGVDQTEVWGKSDSGAYALLYTIAAGTVTKSESVTPVDLRYYKLRTKNSIYYSDYTTEVSITMLGANLIPAASSNFNTDGTAYWTVGSGSKAWNAGGYMTITGSGGSPLFYKSILTAGKKYRVKCDLKSSVYTNVIAYEAGGGLIQNGTAISSSWHTDTVYIQQTTADLILYCMFNATLTGAVDIYNIIVQEILMP